MHKLYNLRDKLVEQLESYDTESELDLKSLEIIDVLAHAIKNMDKIIETCEKDDSYGTRGRSTHAMRDNMGRYLTGPSDTNMMTDLSNLMMDTSDENTRRAIQSMINKYR